MKIVQGYTFDDVLLVPKHSTIKSRSHIDISTDLGKDIKLQIPIISANMKTITGPKMAATIAAAGGLAILHRFSDDQLSDLHETYQYLDHKLELTKFVGISIGIQEADKAKLDEIVECSSVRVVCVDVAHGDHDSCLKMVQWIASQHSNLLIIAGNVATAEGAYRLFQAGADVIKIGVGPGSLCTTRIETGNGVPQLTALSNVWDHFPSPSKIGLSNLRRPKFIADGGIKAAGDIVKSLCFSNAVMLGNIFAGTDEAPGEVVMRNGFKYKTYVGSSTHKSTHIEGVAALVPYKGSVNKILTKLAEGVKSGLSYQGASNIEQLQRDPVFVTLSHAGLVESHPHDVLL